MSNKVKFKKITNKELQGVTLIIAEYFGGISLKWSDFSELTIGFVLYDLARKLNYYIETKPQKCSFSLPLHQVSALYIALDKTKYTDDFSKHIVRKFQSVIQKDFINRM